MKIAGLSKGGQVTFRVNGKEFTGEVVEKFGTYFIDFEGCSNSVVFRELDLDPEDFCEEVCHVETYGGDWPEVETLEELETVVNCLKEEISKKEAAMSARETLINFMMKKQARLGDSVNYFDWKDAQAINSWREDVAQGILDSMARNTSRDDRLVDAAACPFCYKHDTPIGKECKVCEWGANHGICDHSPSDYRKARGIAARHHLRLGDLADMLQSPKPTTLKRWEDRREGDHPEQAYIRFDDEGPIDSFRVYICNRDGKRWSAGTLVQIHPDGLFVNDGVDPEVSRYIKMDGDRLHIKG